MIAVMLFTPLFARPATAGAWTVTYSNSYAGYGESIIDLNYMGYVGGLATGFDNSAIQASVTVHIDWVPSYPGDMPAPALITYRKHGIAQAWIEASVPSSLVANSTVSNSLGSGVVTSSGSMGFVRSEEGYGDFSFYGGGGGGSYVLGVSFTMQPSASIDTYDVETTGAFAGVKVEIIRWPMLSRQSKGRI